MTPSIFCRSRWMQGLARPFFCPKPHTNGLFAVWVWMRGLLELLLGNWTKVEQGGPWHFCHNAVSVEKLKRVEYANKGGCE
jgi:hypothetical protein